MAAELLLARLAAPAELLVLICVARATAISIEKNDKLKKCFPWVIFSGFKPAIPFTHYF